MRNSHCIWDKSLGLVFGVHFLKKDSEGTVIIYLELWLHDYQLVWSAIDEYGLEGIWFQQIDVTANTDYFYLVKN